MTAQWKDHDTRELVDRLTECALKYRDAQQLRERIAHEIRPLADRLKESEKLK